MEGDKIRSGDFLKDVEIKILIRSSEVDLQDLRNIMQAIVASAYTLDTEVTFIEKEEKFNQTSERILRVLTYSLYIK